MKKAEAKRKIIAFVKKYAGKTVLFDGLDVDEKLAYVLTDSYRYFDFLEPSERLNRAIENALAHKANGYEHMGMYGVEMMRLSKA